MSDVQNYFFTVFRELGKEDYIEIKKYAATYGTRIADGIYFQGFSKDEETEQPLRVYEIEFEDEEGFSYSLICQFRDDILRIVNIYNIDDYAKPVKEGCYGTRDLDEIIKEDSKRFNTLLKKLDIEAEY